MQVHLCFLGDALCVFILTLDILQLQHFVVCWRRRDGDCWEQWSHYSFTFPNFPQEDCGLKLLTFWSQGCISNLSATTLPQQSQLNPRLAQTNILSDKIEAAAALIKREGAQSPSSRCYHHCGTFLMPLSQNAVSQSHNLACSNFRASLFNEGITLSSAQSNLRRPRVTCTVHTLHLPCIVSSPFILPFPQILCAKALQA